MMDDDDLDHMLRAARADTVPLGDGLRARILADAARRPAPAPKSGLLPAWLGGILGVPTAAALGLWIGVAQADLVLTYMPGTSISSEGEAALLDDVFGTAWIEGETG
ncbi:hypothetical protein [Jannaschia donghaensis]|uniref:Uncharacterized protein n=1 Tax=Jannaschia donghaensis TaxID=420998 RepID=A0A0M6YFT0_9RHOB|nr:hypothetical protein [Jannaschia donghaensis]CTQ48794.1 hypothetical protein JDO7802_00799 [Jannaschia donghaensis]